MKDTNFGADEKTSSLCNYCYGFYPCPIPTKLNEEAGGCTWANAWSNGYVSTFCQNASGTCLSKDNS